MPVYWPYGHTIEQMLHTNKSLDQSIAVYLVCVFVVIEPDALVLLKQIHALSYLSIFILYILSDFLWR